MAILKDGSRYAPSAETEAVVAPGEFEVAGVHFDHGHLVGQLNGLRDAGATVSAVFDPDPERAEALARLFPGAEIRPSLDAVLEDDAIRLVACAAVPDERGPIGCRVMRAGKDYFSDKGPFTTLDQLEAARVTARETARKFMVYYSERLHNDAAWHAGELIEAGAIGRVLQVVNLAPHRLAKESRPAWFFEKRRYGGILTDIGSHQAEQFLAYTGATGTRVEHARVANLASPEHSELEDFGEMTLVSEGGVSMYCRVDWLTPEGLPVWGDGRTFVLGTEGTLEVRKYYDPGHPAPASTLWLADREQTLEIDCQGKTGFPFFGRLIRDCLERSESAMTQEHAFEAARICLEAQAIADAGR